MKINPSQIDPSLRQAEANSVNQSKKANRTEKADQRVGSRVAAEDMKDAARPEISSRAKEMAEAKGLAQNAPDVRENRIAELRQRIADGKYEVKAEAVADRILSEHMDTRHLG
jgi:negative regulator of flagellin synthesis FlgM